MKKYIFSFLLFLMVMSCDNRHETNGEFAGMWQLTHWRTSDGRDLTRKHLYYCVELELIKFMDSDNVMRYHLARFSRTRDSLFVGPVYSYPGDSTCSVSALQKFGVPVDGKFHIDCLNSQNMQLGSAEGTLQFRKY